MTDRTCKYCGKAFKYPSLLKRHHASKRKCVPAFAGEQKTDPRKNHRCKFCGACFTEETHKYRHMRISCNIAPNAKNGTRGLDRLYELVSEKQNEDRMRIESLETQISAMNKILIQQGAGHHQANIVGIAPGLFLGASPDREVEPLYPLL